MHVVMPSKTHNTASNIWAQSLATSMVLNIWAKTQDYCTLETPGFFFFFNVLTKFSGLVENITISYYFLTVTPQHAMLWGIHQRRQLRHGVKSIASLISWAAAILGV